MYIALYLIAAVLANLIISKVGPSVAPLVALIFVSFDLTSKDRLQYKWGLSWKLIALIGAGSVLTVIFSLGAWRIALASFLAFLLSGLADAFVFERLRHKGWTWSVNGSNVAGAILDSGLFLGIAFGWPLPWITFVLQIAAKIGGGIVYCRLLRRKNNA